MKHQKAKRYNIWRNGDWQFSKTYKRIKTYFKELYRFHIQKKLQIKPHLGILLLGWQIPKTDKTYRTIVTIWPEISHKHILAVWKANNGWPTSLHQGRISFSSKRWISVLDMVE